MNMNVVLRLPAVVEGRESCFLLSWSTTDLVILQPPGTNSLLNAELLNDTNKCFAGGSG